MLNYQRLVHLRVSQVEDAAESILVQLNRRNTFTNIFEHHYYLNLQSIAVNGKILPIDPATFTSHDRGTIIDSGTTLGYLVEEAYVPFVRAITSAVSPSLTPFISDEK